MLRITYENLVSSTDPIQLKYHFRELISKTIFLLQTEEADKRTAPEAQERDGGVSEE